MFTATASRPRRAIAAGAGLLMALLALVVLPLPPAYAVGPELTLTKGGSSRILAGDPANYTLTATNPSQTGAVPEYNVSFRDELPVGVTYTAGSTSPASFGEPQVIVDPVDGHQTLLWVNVTDLPAGASETLGFTVDVNSTTHPVGSTFSNVGDVYAHTDPRTVPKFDASGDPVPASYTESATSGPTVTTVTAITIAKAEPSPESELLRGVHNHSTVYTLTVRNSAPAPTTGVTVVDYLPAGLEFLGCGDVDNGSGVEYPGAPRLDAIPNVATDCPTPVRVDTVLDPPGKAPGVYTRVEWSLGVLGAGQTARIRYAAGIPQRANTMTFAGGTPTPASLGQAANLNNNTGASTRELGGESGLRNYAEASGTYTGPIVPGTSRAVSDSTTRTVSIEDVALQKSVAPTQFTPGGVATYTLLVSLSEYADASGIVLTDILPDGLCPLSTTTNYAPGAPAACASGPGFGTTGASFATVVANPNGSYSITFTPLAAAADGTLTVTYQARMRAVYGSTGQPTVSGDDYVNSVSLVGVTTPAPGVGSPDTGPVDITDDSSAALSTDQPSLTKLIQPDVTPYTCSTDPSGYLDPVAQPAADVVYDEGSRVCFRLRLDFSTSNSTRNPSLTDFLPAYLSYETGSAQVVAGSQPATLVSTDPLRWNIGTTQGGSRFVPAGAFFEVRFSSIVTKPAPGPQPDITANLAKFAWQSTAGRSFGLRDQLDLSIQAAPPATILKAATRADGTPMAEGASVVADELLRYSVTVGNSGTAANKNDEDILGPDVWDVLPAGVTCAEISAISDGGACTNPGSGSHPTFALRDTRSAIRWNLPDSVRIAPGATRALTYTLRVPTGASVDTTYTNTASVASYATETNRGTLAQHNPASNVDTTTAADQIDVPVATDTFTVVTPAAAVVKSNVTSITESGNGVNDAVIGELVTYTVDATIPANTSVYSGVLTDPLPAGLTFVSATGQRSVDGGATFGALPAGFTLGAANGTLTFPAAYATGAGQNHVFRVTIVARLANVAANSHGTGLLNVASLTSLSGPGGTALTPRNGSSTVTVVTPNPSLAKTDDDADKIIAIGQDVTFTLTSTNAAGRPPAHDAFVVDCVPAALQVTRIVAGSPSQGTASFGASTGSDGCAVGQTRVVWNVGDLAPGASPTLSYVATLGPTATGGLVVTNTARQTSSTLDDDKAAPGDPDNPNELVLTNTASDTLTVRGATVTKSVDQPTRTIGERATYTVEATLPAGVNFYDAAVTDLLPAGLDVATVQTQSVTCAPACTVDGTPLTPSGSTIGWSLGDVLTSPQPRTVAIVYSAVVADVAGNQRGTSLTNGARVRWDVTDGTNPTSAGAAFDQSSATATATFTVTEPLLSIDKTVSDTTPEPGQRFSYTVAVTNSAAANISGANNVTVVDTVPVGVVVDPLTISNGGVLSGQTTDGGGTITWTLGGPVGQGVTRSLTYEATLASPTLTAALTNTADVTRYTSTAAGGREYDGPADTATVTAALPFVEIDKAVVGDGLAYLGEPTTWRITVTSSGDATAYGVDVKDVLPPNWTYDAGSAQVVVDGGTAIQTDPATATAAGVQTLDWTDLADLPVGDTIVITFTATPQPGAVASPGVGGGIDHVNTGSTTAEDADGNQGPAGGGSYHGPADTAAAHIDAADVTIDKAHTGVPVAGQAFSWTVTVANAGPDTAAGPFTVTDTLPAGVTGAVASGAGWTCSPTGAQLSCTRTAVTDTLASGATFPVIAVTVNVPADLVEGTVLTNAVVVTDKTYDPNPANNSDEDDATVDASADLTVDKALVGALVAGSPATYTLDVTNLGPSVSRGEITVTDTLPAGSSFVSADGAGWTCPPSVGVVTCTRPGPAGVGALPQITITVDIPADQLGPVRNAASVDGPQDDNPANDDDAVTTDPATSADLALEKESPGEFVAGEQGVYRFTVTNNGPSDAQSPVRITDTLPGMLTYVDFTSVTGTWTCSAVGQDVTCTLTGSLADEGVAVVEITVDIDSTHTGPITNAATVTSSTPDPNDANNTDGDDTGVNTRADLSIAKSHTGLVVAGQQVTYDLAVRNNGPSLSPATVTVTDTLPTGTTYAGWTGAAWTCTPAGQVVTCDLTGSLASRTDAPPLSITADVAPDAGPATLVNAASVDGPVADPNPDNNNASDPTDVVDRANVSIAKAVTGPNPTVAGQEATFEIVVSNDGPSVADSVVVTDALPAGLSLVSASGSGWTCGSGAPITCIRDTIGAGVDAPVITVVALVGAGVPDGTQIVNAASVTTATEGDDPGDNGDDATLDVVARADLVLTKSHPAAPVAAGTSTTFTIEVRNEGPSDAIGPLVVTDTLPAGLSYLSASGGWLCDAVGADVTCTLPGDLLAGTSAPVLGVTVQIDATVDPQDLTNVASVTSSTVDPTPGNNTDDAVVAVVQNADLGITKSHVGIGLVGEQLTFTLQVSNAGPSEANAVTVTDTLPAGLDFVSAEGAGWTCTAAGSDIVCDLADPLAPDTAATPITVIVLVQAEAYPGVTNVAGVTSDATDTNTDDNTATDDVEVAPLVNLTLDKSHAGDFKVGEEETFTLEVTNEGPTPAPGPITVTDTLPGGLTFVSASGPGWTCAEADGTVVCEHGELAVGEVSTITLVVQVEAAAYPSVTNVASVTSDSAETDDTDNAAEDPVTVVPLVVLSLVKDLVSVTQSKAVFDLTVTNEGPNDTVDPIVLTDPLPQGLVFVSASGSGWACSASGRTVTCTRDASLSVGETSTVRLVTEVTAKPGADVTNVASVVGGGADGPAADDALVEVPPVGDQGGDGGGLPDTGGPPFALIPLAALLVLGGGALVVGGTRRRRREG